MATPPAIPQVDENGRLRCTATGKKTGQRCKRPPIVGGTVCSMHGGSAPQVKAAAVRRQVDAAAEALTRRIWDADADPIVDHVAAIQGLAGQMRTALDRLGAMLNPDDDHPDQPPLDLDSVTATAWIRVMRELRQLLADMGRMGIAERALELEARRIRMVSAAFGRALDALQIPPADRDRVAEVFISELRNLAPVAIGGD